MVILDQTDLDRTTADALVNAQVEAVVNAAQSISGRFPNLGPEVLVASGITLLDDVGIDVFNKVREGVKVRINDDKLYIGERRVALGVELVETDIADRMIEAKSGVVDHLEAFSGNAIEYLRSESPLLIDGVGVPEVDAELDGMHVVVVADGPGSRRTTPRAQALHSRVLAGHDRCRCRGRHPVQGRSQAGTHRRRP